MKTLFCQRLKQELPALEYTPYPGELGARVVENISAQAWDDWLAQQTMLINEYRLNLTDKKSREFLEEEMIKYLFEGNDAKPDGYQPESA